MSNQLKPKPSQAMERCTFHSARQNENEIIADFSARLKKLALHCAFKVLEDALKDQLICGLRDMDTKVKLFEEKDLTLEKALTIAVAHETAVKNATTATTTLEKKTHQNELYSIDKGSRPGYSKYTPGQQQRKDPRAAINQLVCYCCGRRNHIKA